MIVYKFGGATTGSARGLESMVALVRAAYQSEVSSRKRKHRSGTPYGLAIVISAIGHTTRYLLRCAEASEESNYTGASEQLQRILTQHEQLIANLKLDGHTRKILDAQMQALVLECKSLIEGVAITRQLTLRVRDSFLAMGERFALALIGALFHERGLHVRTVDARDLIVTNEDFGSASPLLEESIERIRTTLHPLFRRGEVVLTQGFVGSTPEGETTTMGSESSDLTATLLGRALDAQEVTIWKSVPGIFSADPELVARPKLIRTLSFDEAEEIGRRGARVLYKSAAQPLIHEANRTKLRIASPKTKDTKSTIVGDHFKIKPGTIRALALALEENLIPLVLRPKKNTEREDEIFTPFALASNVSKQRAYDGSQSALREASYVWASDQELTMLVKKEKKKQILAGLASSDFQVMESPPVCALSVVFRSSEDTMPLKEIRALIQRTLRTYHVHSTLTVERSIVCVLDNTEGKAAIRKLHDGVFGV